MRSTRLALAAGLAVLFLGGAGVLAFRGMGAGGVRALGGGPLPVAERAVGGAEEPGRAPLPLVIALHGRGDTHERFASVFSRLGVPARLVSIGAPVVESDGRAWFTFGRGWSGAVDDLDACVPRILATMQAERARAPVTGRPIVVGFSQGAMLAYLLALRHPDEVGAAFPVSGVSVDSLEPPELDAHRVPPIHAFHGTRDEIISIEDGRESVAHLRALGVPVELTEVPDATHWIGTEMSAALLPAIEAAVAAQAL